MFSRVSSLKANDVEKMHDEPVRIAILLASPFTQDIFRRIGMPYLAETFDVTIIDCALWVRVGAAELSYQRYDYQQLVSVSGEVDFEEKIKRHRPKYAIDFIGKGNYTKRIQNILRRAGTKYVAHRIAPSPIPNRLMGSSSTSVAQSLAIFRRGYSWMRRAIRDENPLPPDVALLAGSKSYDYWTSSSSTILWTASFDYFTLKQIQRTRQMGHGIGRPHEGRFALFIDDCLSLSMDYQMTGKCRPIESEEYFRLLLQALGNIEHSLSIPVVIAAHPDGKEIPNYPSLFGNRPVYFDSTGELALDCEVTLTHYSTAVAYPVLLRKPIVLMNTSRLKYTYQGDAINNLSGLLKCPVLSMEKSASDCSRIMVNPIVPDCTAYENYEKSYITTVSNSDTNPLHPFVKFVTGLESTHSSAVGVSGAAPVRNGMSPR